MGAPSSFQFTLCVKGKLIRKSLKTDLITVAKLRLADLEKSEQEAADRKKETSQVKMMFGEASKSLS